MEQEKLVYVPMVADYLHPGHLNILKEASKLGKVMVGLFSDKAVLSYKRLPHLPFAQRRALVESVRFVQQVVCQDEMDLVTNLRRYQPHYLVHGSDWRVSTSRYVRQKAIEALSEWGGQLVEPDYTEGVSSTALLEGLYKKSVQPEERIGMLHRLMEAKPLVRVMEAHNGISGMVVQSASVLSANGLKREFDAIWLSSLTDSTVKGKPDIEFVDLSSRIVTVNDILECTTKPIIYDGDTGGRIEHFPLMVRRLERLGVSAVIIEDKIGSKKNSLLEPADNLHEADTVEHFCKKILAGKQAQISDDFMIIARIESLILGAGQEDALTRAKAYIDAGADGIMIHSRKADGEEIFAFCEAYNKLINRKPLVAVPTNYSSVREEDLEVAGVNIVIYANHMLRSAYTAMTQTARRILEDGRAYEADENYISALSLLKLIEGNG